MNGRKKRFRTRLELCESVNFAKGREFFENRLNAKRQTREFFDTNYAGQSHAEAVRSRCSMVLCSPGASIFTGRCVRELLWSVRMASATTIRVHKLRFYEPHRNLPNRKAGNGREARFARQFAGAYAAQFRQIHPRSPDNAIAIAREIPANGYGIADCVAVSWRLSKFRSAGGFIAPDHFFLRVKPTLRAFEVKLRDWRQALRQANRYRFFAHVPIVVLPAERCGPALVYLDTFRLLNVGLWSFAPAANRIVAHFTPRCARPRDIQQALRAIGLVARASKALPVS
jgi:hypothetical protein